MFKKAVKDHPGASSRPLQSNLLRVNKVVPSKSPVKSAGIKRKIEMTNGGESALGSLHSAVYFDENDFDDDLDLDIDEPQPLFSPSAVASNPSKPDPVAYPTLDGISTKVAKIEHTKLATGDNQALGVNYPDLPSSHEGTAPSSSIQIPWSSSPPSHLQPPPRPRTLPWLKEVQEEPHQANPSKNMSLATPKRSKSTDFWNKSASAIKEEQKELRRESKKSQKTSAKPRTEGNSKIATVFLSDEQRAVLEAVVDQGKSIFFTGSAGTGKSVLMREIIQKLRAKYRREPDRVAVTASTGLAACNIEGVTLHSFAGIGLGKEAVPELVKKVSSSQRTANARILTTHRLKGIRKPVIVGYVPRFWSSMKCPW
jgi:ATP-dependent DNA helicase PIF1